MKFVYSILFLFMSSLSFAEIEVGQALYYPTGETLVHDWHRPRVEVERMYVAEKNGDTVRLVDSLDSKEPGIKMKEKDLQKATADKVSGTIIFGSADLEVFETHKIVAERGDIFIVQRDDGKLYMITQKEINHMNKMASARPRIPNAKTVVIQLDPTDGEHKNAEAVDGYIGR